MNSSIESYVLVNFKKFNDMEEQLAKTAEAAPTSPRPPSPAVTENEVTENENKTLDNDEGEEVNALTPAAEEDKNSLATVPINDESEFAAQVKPLATAKTLKKRSLEKFLEAIDAYGTDKLGVSNKLELIKGALSQSKKVLANEDRFYAFLLKHRLIHLVTHSPSPSQ